MSIPFPAILFTILSSLFLATNAHANAQSAPKTDSAKPEQRIAAKKRVSIHLESYADAKSAATAQEIAALLEERLSKRPSASRQSEFKKPAKTVNLKDTAKPVVTSQ